MASADEVLQNLAAQMQAAGLSETATLREALDTQSIASALVMPAAEDRGRESSHWWWLFGPTFYRL
jgi:hypothetical protein